MAEHIRKGFTNFRDAAAAGGDLDKYFLVNLDNNQIVSMSDIPELTLPCNFLANREGVNGYYPPAYHTSQTDGSLHSTSFTVGSFSYEAEIGNDGITDLNNTINFASNTHPYIYKGDLIHSMRQAENGPFDSTPGTIALGQGASDTADDYGLMDGFTVQMDGAQVFLPEWDVTIAVDDALQNAPYAGEKNNVDLPSSKELEICEDRSWKAYDAEHGRIIHCNYHMDNSEPHDHAASNTPPSCSDFDVANAKSNCLNTCKGSAEVNRSWLSDCNPCVDKTRRVDLAYTCGCGGIGCAGENLACGWEVILNQN